MKPIEIKLDKPKAPPAIAGVTVGFNGVRSSGDVILFQKKLGMF